LAKFVERRLTVPKNAILAALAACNFSRGIARAAATSVLSLSPGGTACPGTGNVLTLLLPPLLQLLLLEDEGEEEDDEEEPSLTAKVKFSAG
jgi:hypothetical protein